MSTKIIFLYWAVISNRLSIEAVVREKQTRFCHCGQLICVFSFSISAGLIIRGSRH